MGSTLQALGIKDSIKNALLISRSIFYILFESGALFEESNENYEDSVTHVASALISVINMLPSDTVPSDFSREITTMFSQIAKSIRIFCERHFPWTPNKQLVAAADAVIHLTSITEDMLDDTSIII
jgi:hypothetical protein